MSGKAFGSDCCVGGRNSDVGTKMICNSDYAIESVIHGTGADEIDCDGVTTGVRDREGMQRTRWFGCAAFVPLTVSACGDVGLKLITMHVWPVVGVT